MLQLKAHISFMKICNTNVLYVVEIGLPVKERTTFQSERRSPLCYFTIYLGIIYRVCVPV